MLFGRPFQGRSPAVVFALAPALAIAGCSSGNSEPESGGTESPAPAASLADGVLAARYSAWGRQGRVELLALERVAGKAVVARFRLTNESGEDYPIMTSLSGDGERNRERPGSVDTNAISAVSLLDERNSKQYFPLNRADGQCLCTRYHPFPEPVRAGESRELAAAFPAPPEDVRSMGVLFPHAPPFLNVPITDVDARAYTFDEPQGPVDPSAEETGPPLVLPVLATVEQEAAARDDDGENLRVRLAADVLFATDSADLGADARERLRSVAADIDRSADTEIEVDGHTDDTGNDAINEPLSRRRAEAVEAALGDLVTRTGVAFRARGHGSGDPVASNETEGGRSKNRRVTVTFARPAPPAPAPSARASAPASPGGGPAAGPAGGAAPHWPHPVLGRADADPATVDDAPGANVKDARVEVNALTRAPSGFATLVFTIVNEDRAAAFDPARTADLDGLYVGSGTSGVTLRAGDRTVRSLRAADRSVVGSPDFAGFGPDSRYHVAPGKRLTFWTTFRVPDGIGKATVRVPGFAPVADVPVGK